MRTAIAVNGIGGNFLRSVRNVEGLEDECKGGEAPS